MSNTNNEFKFKMTEWRGYVIRALEDLDRGEKEIKEWLRCLDRKVNKLQIKVAGIGAIAGLLGGLLVLALRFWFLG